MIKIIKKQKKLIVPLFCSVSLSFGIANAQDAVQAIDENIQKQDEQEVQLTQDKQYNTLQEALKGGGFFGDVGVFGVYQTQQESTDLGYVGGSVGLTYQSGFYHNMRLSLGFRSALPFWQLHKIPNPNSLYPAGDMSADFDPRYPTILSDSYLQFLYGGNNIKGGRFFVENEWVSNQVDGLSYTNTSLEGLTFDLVWFYSYGDATSTSIAGFEKANPNHWSGLYYTALSYSLADELFGIKFYTFGSYDIAYALGGNISTQYTFKNNLKLGAYLNSAVSFEQKKSEFSENGLDIDGKIFLGYENFDWVLGFVKSGKNVGWGSLGRISDTINPLEIGDGFEGVDLGLFYTTLEFNIDRYTLSLLYGFSIFTDPSLNAKGQQNEIDLTLEIQATQDFMVYAGVYNTHLSKLAPNSTKGQIGISYSF